MKYRIITNGSVFRVQHRCWYWPFWICEKEFLNYCNDCFYRAMQFSSQKDAEYYLANKISEQKWKEVK